MVYEFYSYPEMELEQIFIQYPVVVRENVFAVRMNFSPCGKYIVVIDTLHATTILNRRSDDAWAILGKSQIHNKPVICKLESE